MLYRISKIVHYCLITILAIFIGISTINAQDGRQGKKVFALGMHAYYGFILKHTESIGHLAQSHPYALEFNLNRITDGSKAWHKEYRYPEVGYAIGFTISETLFWEKRCMPSPIWINPW